MKMDTQIAASLRFLKRCGIDEIDALDFDQFETEFLERLQSRIEKILKYRAKGEFFQTLDESPFESFQQPWHCTRCADYEDVLHDVEISDLGTRTTCMVCGRETYRD